MSQDIHELLKTHGPCVTSELINRIIEQGVNPAAARQRVTRAGGIIKKLAGLRLAHNARFIYLENDYGSTRYWQALERTLKNSGKSYWSAIVGLKAKGGQCWSKDFPIICGTPSNRKGQLSPQRIFERLYAINLLEEIEDKTDLGKCIHFKPTHYSVINNTSFRALMLAENISLNAVRDWARRLGLGSYGKFRIRGDAELPSVAGVAWDLTAPSYIRPLVSVSGGKLKPGFLVCDLHLQGLVENDLVESFIRKYELTAAPKNVSPVIAMLVADGFTNSAFDLAKSRGMIPVTIRNLFGEDVSKALHDLIGLLTDTGATAVKNPDHLERVMSKLSQIEGAANNLRGDLFELVVGTLVKDIQGGFVRMGYEVTNLESGKKAEVDVILDHPDQKNSLVIECKAKIPGSQVSLSDVKKWYLDRVPLINETLRQQGHYIDSNIRFEIWTNGSFHHSALAWLDKQKTTFEGFSLGWKDGEGVKAYSISTQNKSIKKMLDEHYFRNPLTMLSNRNDIE